jgi:hypothetical protein
MISSSVSRGSDLQTRVFADRNRLSERIFVVGSGAGTVSHVFVNRALPPVSTLDCIDFECIPLTCNDALT